MKFYRIIAFVVIVSFLAAGGFASASHSWGNYHWGRTANPFTLMLGDNVSSVWENYLGSASADWSMSTVLDTSVVAGSSNPKNCRPKAGRVEVCNSGYGFNGWLGIASIWISGDHISQGTVKVNDSYFNTAAYNTPEWKQTVMCQEIGHVFGLNHQDENFDNANLDTCMDYTSDPASNQHPNQHDYDQLEAIYSHLDLVNTYDDGSSTDGGKGSGNGKGKKGAEVTDDPSSWGKVVKQSKDGKSSIHIKDLDKNDKIITFVIWAE